MREWYRAKSPEQRREYVSRRDTDKVRANDRRRYYRDREKRLALSKAYVQTEEGRASASKAKREWRKRNPDAVRAHNAVARALRKGTLVRQPCRCGNPRSEAHHPDYSKPLEVEWLCRRCHAEDHRREGE